MTLKKQLSIATVLVLATVIPYAGYAIEGEFPLVQDARGMGFIGLVFGAIAWFVLRADAFGPRWVGVGGGLVALALGVTAAVLETGTASSVFLGAFIVVMVAMWATAVIRHTDVAPGRVTGRMTPRHG